MRNLIDLSGKTILVTGASSGIGRNTAVILSEVGANVILTGRNEERLKETMEMMSGSEHAYYPYDLCNLSDMEQFVKMIVECHGKLQGLAACAGIANVRPCKLISPEIMQKVMTTNFFSFFELVRQFAKKKYSDDGAKIVAISSVASTRPDKGQAAYAVSKAAIDASVVVLAQELIPRHININSIHPGMVDTPMTRNTIDESRKIVMERQPLGFIPAEDVAIMSAYLLSAAADMITGRSFDVDGGVLL